MNINYKILKDKLQQYYAGDLELSALGSWAASEYYDILRGGYVMLEKIAVYKFLKILSEINTVPDDIRDEFPCSAEDIRHIYEILCGDENEVHTIRVKIPRKVYEIYGDNPHLSLADRDEKVEIKKILTRLSQNKTLSDGEIDVLKSMLNKPLSAPQTLLDLLEIQLKPLLERILHILHFDSDRSAFGLYVDRDEFSDTRAIADAEKLLACYIGEKSFNVCVVYQSGIPNISMII